MHNITWQNRIVYLVFDNDMWTNPKVEKALIKLASILISKFNAKVKVINLPKVNKKLGLDDYLVEYGPEKFKKLIDEAEEMTLSKAQNILQKEEKINYPIEILPEKFKDFTLSASEIMDAPIEFIASSLIAGAAALINSKGKIIIKKDWIEPCILWTMLIAKPGKQSKSPSLKLIKK